MRKIIKIESTDHTDTLVIADKIMFVSERKNGCAIFFDSGICVTTTANIKDFQKALEKCFDGGDTK
jgi:hypothetical protein